MKICMLCGHEDVDKSFTCPKCGEATWSDEIRVEVPEEAPAEAPVPVSRKGKK